MVVDDDPFTNSLLDSLLADSGFEVALCGDAGSARALIPDFDPDLVILDVNLGNGPSGMQLGFVLEQAHPDIAFMYLTRYPTALLSAQDSTDHLRGKTILSKDSITSSAILIDAIEATLRGTHIAPSDLGDEQVRGLTRIQLSILAMMTSGMTNAAIAEQRGTSERAVEKQVKAIYETLGLASDRETNARVLAALRYSEAMGDHAPADDRAVHG